MKEIDRRAEPVEQKPVFKGRRCLNCYFNPHLRESGGKESVCQRYPSTTTALIGQRNPAVVMAGSGPTMGPIPITTFSSPPPDYYCFEHRYEREIDYAARQDAEE